MVRDTLPQMIALSEAYIQVSHAGETAACVCTLSMCVQVYKRSRESF
jgi:hypothetical protein